MKSYTDIEQSKKLAEFLPIESADMFYRDNGIDVKLMWEHNAQKVTNPCWSLAALLAVLPFHLIIDNQRYAFSMHKGLNIGGETYTLSYDVFNTDICLYSTEYYNSPVDACVEMILKLHEFNLL